MHMNNKIQQKIIVLSIKFIIFDWKKNNGLFFLAGSRVGSESDPLFPDPDPDKNYTDQYHW